VSDVVTVSDFSTYCGGATGSYTSTQIQLGLDIAEWIAEEFLVTPLTPTAQTEEYPWPILKELQLKKRRIISIDTVTSLHYLDCDCEWETETECAVTYDALQGIVFAVAYAAFPCCTVRGCWCGCTCPARIRIVYTAGFPSGYFTGSKVGSVFRMAICQIARWALDATTSLTAEGEKDLQSWSSMDYSESFGAAADWVAGVSADPRVRQALNLLKMIKKKRFLGITGRA